MNGGAGNDVLIGDVNINTIAGQGGADFIIGGNGGDLLIGGAGADYFAFGSITDSPGGPAMTDLIADFTPADGDVVDVSPIDANVYAAGNQAFVFASAFVFGTAGQAVLSYDAGTNTTTLSLDVNADAVADFVLNMTGNIGQGGWFVL